MQLIPSSSIRTWKADGKVRIPLGISTVCPHCSALVTFSLSGDINDRAHRAVASTSSCPGCSKKVFFWAVRHERDPRGDENNPAAVYMYPPAKDYYQRPEFPTDFPASLGASFVSTIDSLNSKNYVATAVGGRRTLEGIFKYLVPEEKRNATLARLIDLAMEEIDLAEPIAALSHAIRGGGNLGAHFDPEREPDEAIARQIVELLDYLISYLYVLPNRIRELEQSLGKEKTESGT